MSAHCLALSLHDTGFFRDGRPFNQEDEGMVTGETLFPPAPRTIVACIRTALAEGAGWAGGNWADDMALTKLVGAGPDLGAFSVSGFCVSANGEKLYPAPKCLAAIVAGNDRKLERIEFLRPDDAVSTETDIGSFSLARMSVAGGSILDDWWVTRDGMTSVLKGTAPRPEHLVASQSLFSSEIRIGIARRRDTRQVEEGRLYQVRHARMGDDVKLLVACNFPEGEKVSPRRPFGGEGRVVWIEQDGLDWRPTDNAQGDKILAVALTPIMCDPLALRPGTSFFGTTLEITSVCTSRPDRGGGWSSQAADFGPQPMRNVIPAGAVFFLRGASGENAPLPAQLGKETAFGYGAVCYGHWGA